MKLNTQVSREYKGKKYYKHRITVPKDAIEELDWDTDQELEWEVEDGKLIIEKESSD